ncbi:hypothetical protein ACFVYG_19675 [Streptomyces sp. NPDC058256]|uniref:hypothetical protein n=1 Tax=Streptomyces sp. NPDC058256 TaxID=3346408 RepID=UPI0036E54D35
MLYQNQPEEVVDGFTEAYLLELVGEVDGLRGQAFHSAVKTMKYRDFVTKSEQPTRVLVRTTREVRALPPP